MNDDDDDNDGALCSTRRPSAQTFSSPVHAKKYSLTLADDQFETRHPLCEFAVALGLWLSVGGWISPYCTVRPDFAYLSP